MAMFWSQKAISTATYMCVSPYHFADSTIGVQLIMGHLLGPRLIHQLYKPLLVILDLMTTTYQIPWYMHRQVDGTNLSDIHAQVDLDRVMKLASCILIFLIKSVSFIIIHMKHEFP